MNLTDEYLRRHSGDRIEAAVDLAHGLTHGNPATLKQGYTPENAVLAVTELFRLTDDERDRVTERMR